MAKKLPHSLDILRRNEVKIFSQGATKEIYEPKANEFRPEKWREARIPDIGWAFGLFVELQMPEVTAHNQMLDEYSGSSVAQADPQASRPSLSGELECY